MSAATVTSKGQVTIPRDVRDDLGLVAGDRLDFVRLAEGRYAIMAKTGSIMDLKGALGPREKPVSLEEMQEAIVAGAIGA